MRRRLLIYGATGFTGRLCARAAVDLGMEPILAGRSGDKLRRVAESLGAEHCVVRLDEPERLVNALRGVAVVLHAAGPFSTTALAMAQACIRTGTHYLDLAADIEVFERIHSLGRAARERGVMLMPGVGFDVVASDCLAAHVAKRLPAATHLRIGIGGLALVSRGSAKGLIERAGEATHVRRNGQIVAITPGTLEHLFDFGEGPTAGIAVSWGDVSTAYRTTGIPNVEVYFEAIPPVRLMLMASRYFSLLLQNPISQVMLKTATEILPEGPSESERKARKAIVVAEVVDEHGRRAASRLIVPEAYDFSTDAALGVAARVLDGDVKPGSQTPSTVYGPDFVLEFKNVVRADLS